MNLKPKRVRRRTPIDLRDMLLLASLVFASLGLAGSLKDVKHVVLFMQENRAFDHYFGTMSGVRGFGDPNLQINPDGRTTFQQFYETGCLQSGPRLVSKKESNKTDQLTPWYINYLGGHWYNATQCIGAGSNSWEANHYALNGGLNNKWVTSNTPYSWGYFKRRDIPVHFDIAEGWTVGDMYQEGVLAATDPNRIVWMSSTVNNPGTPSNPDGKGGMMLDNSATPGCEKPHLNCFPLTWKTIPEYWQAAGVTWQVYQDRDNFEDNMLAYFKQYQKAGKDSPLTTRGNSYIGIRKFREHAAAGTLPQISYIVGPAELSEHPPYLPSDGAWLQKHIVDIVTSSPLYNQTVLLISYDEIGGFGDHVTPFHAPKGTRGEWIDDPYELFGETPVGPGFRIPFYIISPWTRGGHVFTEHTDHNSQNLFVEEWLHAIGKKNIRTKEMPPWRREHMSNLLKAFDFEHPDYTLPNIADTTLPLRDHSEPPPKDGDLGALDGNYIGAAKCQSMYKTSQPPVPYGPKNAQADPSKLVEEGFKPVRGSLTEGRYLTFEMRGQALSNVASRHVDGTKASANHEKVTQRWIIHYAKGRGENVFLISSAKDGKYISSSNSLVSAKKDATPFTIGASQNTRGYTLKSSRGCYLQISSKGKVTCGKTAPRFSVYSVSYQS